MAEPTTAELLVKAVRSRELPQHPQTLKDYGFTRYDSLRQVVMLFNVYNSLVNTCWITSCDIQKWMSKGRINFFEKVKRELESSPTEVPAHRIVWLRANQHILEMAHDDVNGDTQTDISDPVTFKIVKRFWPKREVLELEFIRDATIYAANAALVGHTVKPRETADKIYVSGPHVRDSSVETTADILIQGISSGKAPTDHQTMKDYRFDRCHSAEDTKGLLSVYDSLVNICGVQPQTLHKWMSEDNENLGKHIKRTIESISFNVPYEPLAWFSNNIHIWYDKETSTQIARECLKLILDVSPFRRW